MKVCIDAGHAKNTPGKRSFDGTLLEYEFNRYVASVLKYHLERHGVKTMYSCDVDTATDISLSSRCKTANDAKADLFVSIHANAFGTTWNDANGWEIFTYKGSTKGTKLAEAIRKESIALLKLKDRGIKTDSLYVTKHTSMPAVLIEHGFYTNKEECAKLKDTEFREKCAIADAKGILAYSGIAWKEETAKSETKGEQTVMKIPDDVYVQEINPKDFSLKVCDCKKRSIDAPKYFNAGFFSGTDKNTVPVGNLACGGKIITQAKDNEGWINTSKKKLTTIYTTISGLCDIVKTEKLDSIVGLKEAISGIPIIVSGKKVSMDDIKAEGYFGNECYNTWHGFLGIRNDKLVYVAMKCGFEEMCWTLVALGIYDAIKLDGGGSFILHDEKEIVATSENRRIHNIGVWTQ
jgi:N-acetylmuramoyl-L-alanine amidase